MIRQDTFSKAYFRDSQKVKTSPGQGDNLGSNPNHGAISVLLFFYGVVVEWLMTAVLKTVEG